MVADIGLEPPSSRRLPSRRAPVPQSNTKTPPEGVFSSTQDVLPPKWLVPGPGAAIDPRVPQKRTRILTILSTLALHPSRQWQMGVNRHCPWGRHRSEAPKNSEPLRRSP